MTFIPIQKIKSALHHHQSRSVKILMIVAFVLWIWLMRGFLFGDLSLIGDAVPYHNHTRFFVNNMAQGVFPLWEPLDKNDGGVPNEFYLRRIGEFNPFYSLIILLRLAGLPFTQAYLIFLALYFWIGAIGFFLLVQAMTKDRLSALVGYLLLLFSSLTTNLFDNYIHLLWVPTVWFFFFLVSFFTRPQKHFLLGLTLCAMVIMTTYIPFYFIIIFVIFLMLYLLFYPLTLKKLFSVSFGFIRKNKLITVFCLLAFCFSVVPGYLFYKEGAKKETIMPKRHYDSGVENTVQVDIRKVSKMGILAHVDFDHLFSFLQRYRLAIFYIPLFAYILLLLGLMNKLDKRHYFYALWGLIVFFVGSPDVSSLHKFLYKHIFLFRYFRNLHFFLWILILPLILLFLSEQFHLWQIQTKDNPDSRKRKIVFVLLVHIGFFLFLLFQPHVIVSSYVVLLLSLLTLILIIQTNDNQRQGIIPFILFAVIIFQPLEVNNYLFHNALLYKDSYRNELDPSLFSFTRYPKRKQTITQEDLERKDPDEEKVIFKPARKLYYACQWYNMAYQNLNYDIFDEYRRHKFYVYDHVSLVNDKKLDIDRIQKSLFRNQNVAFVSSDEAEYDHFKAIELYSPFGEIPTQTSEHLKILDYNVNYLKIRTDYDTEKFIVYNDAFHSKWHAFINGVPVKILRSNIAFKGFWIPAGENIIEYRYGGPKEYELKIIIWLLFQITFLLTLFFAVKSKD